MADGRGDRLDDALAGAFPGSSMVQARARVVDHVNRCLERGGVPPRAGKCLRATVAMVLALPWIRETDLPIDRLVWIELLHLERDGELRREEILSIVQKMDVESLSADCDSDLAGSDDPTWAMVAMLATEMTEGAQQFDTLGIPFARFMRALDDRLSGLCSSHEVESRCQEVCVLVAASLRGEHSHRLVSFFEGLAARAK